MLTIKVNSYDKLEKIHKSLVGFKPYIENDIIVSANNDNTGGEVIIGFENENDYTIEI